MPAVRFRTQDTKASWARKLNTLLLPEGIVQFREVPQTHRQWLDQLNGSIDVLVGEGYEVDETIRFRFSDTRQMMARKLNLLSASVEAGVPEPDPE